MTTGWIALYRRIVEHWIWNTSSKRLQRWIDLLFLATWQPEKEVLYGNKLIKLKRGQYATSVRQLMKRWATNNHVVGDTLKLFESAGMISCERGRRMMIITVCNYEKYQFAAIEAQSIDENGDYAVVESKMNNPKRAVFSHEETHVSDEKRMQERLPNKEDNIINNKQNTSFSSSVREINLKFCSDFKSNGKEMEDLAKLLKCNLELVGLMMDDFIIEAVDEEHENAAKFRKHFIGWARIYLKKNGKDGHKQSKQEANPSSQGKTVDRLSPRRGFDPGIHEAKDFEGKF